MQREKKNTHSTTIREGNRLSSTEPEQFFFPAKETELKQFCAPHIISRRNHFMAVKIYHRNIRFTYLQIRKKLHSTS